MKRLKSKGAMISYLVATLAAGYTPQIMDFVKASGLGVPTRHLAHEVEQRRLFETHFQTDPIEEVSLDTGRGTLTCSTWVDAALVTFDPPTGRSRYVWVALADFERRAQTGVALAASRKQKAPARFRSRRCGFNKRLGGFVEDRHYLPGSGGLTGKCERRVISASGWAKKKRIACGVSCPR